MHGIRQKLAFLENSTTHDAAAAGVIDFQQLSDMQRNRLTGWRIKILFSVGRN